MLRPIIRIIALILILFGGSEHAQAQPQTTPCTRQLCGNPLFAYAWIPLRDATGQTVINPSTGKPYLGDFCLAWYTAGGSKWNHWVAPRGQEKDDWLTGAEYYVDVSRRTVTITAVAMENVVRTSGPKGYRQVDFPKRIGFKLDPNVVVSLYDQPQQAEPAALGHPEWSKRCDWNSLLAGWYQWYEPGSRGGMSGPTVGQLFPCLTAWNDEFRDVRHCPYPSR